jgi:uncharacterized membrane protein
MAFCTNCGTEVAGAAFCPKCGQAQTGGQVVAQASPTTQPGMAENVAGLLCYLFLWVTGVIFFFIDKRPFVKFHAAQSMVVFGGLFAIRLVIGAFLAPSYAVMGLGAFGLIGALYTLIGLVTIFLWILLMIKAYQGQKYELPIAGGIAKSFAGK